ncbi:MAG: methylaspartate mutase, partial [Armatimonadota bacterium]
AYQPEGVTMLAVDSIFMMPQLGVLSTVHPEAAAQVFDRDCLIRLGTCIAPVGQGKEGEPCLTIEYNGKSETFRVGEIRVLPMGVGETMEALLKPARGFDVGAGRGRAREVRLEGGVVGVVVDARGRPLQLPADDALRRHKLIEWLTALGLPEP